MRINHPTAIIYILKLDLDAEYRRLHLTPDHTVMAMTIVDDVAYLEARLPFGAKSGPSSYSTISECIFDITNDLLEDTTWVVLNLYSPHKSIFDDPQVYHQETPFDVALPLAVPIPVRDLGCDGYIDDFDNGGGIYQRQCDQSTKYRTSSSS